MCPAVVNQARARSTTPRSRWRSRRWVTAARSDWRHTHPARTKSLLSGSLLCSALAQQQPLGGEKTELFQSDLTAPLLSGPMQDGLNRLRPASEHSSGRPASITNEVKSSPRWKRVDILDFVTWRRCQRRVDQVGPDLSSRPVIAVNANLAAL